MKFISRLEGSLVIVQAKDGTLWLARRKKRRSDSRRRTLTKRSVIFIPIETIAAQNTRKILLEKHKKKNIESVTPLENNLYSTT